MTQENTQVKLAWDLIQRNENEEEIIRALLILTNETLLEPSSKLSLQDLLLALLYSNNTTIFDLTCSILMKQNFIFSPAILLKGLEASEQIQIMVLRQMKIQTLTPEITSKIFSLLESSSTLIYKAAQEFIIEKFKSKAEVETASTEFYKIIGKNNELVKIRIYESIAKMSISSYDELHAQGLIDLISELKSRDILILMNKIEILSELANEIDLSFFEKTLIFEKLCDFESFEDLIKLSIIKFWSSLLKNLSYDQIKQVDGKYKIFSRFIELMESRQTAEEVVIAFGNIGGNKDSLMYMIRERMFIEIVMSEMRKYVGDSRIIALRSFSCLIDHGIGLKDEDVVMKVGQDEMSAEEFNNECFNIYKQFQTCEQLLKLTNSLVVEIAIGALACLKTIVGFEWGVKELLDASSFRTLLERKKETILVIKVLIIF
jgi:hypothetical protein